VNAVSWHPKAIENRDSKLKVLDAYFVKRLADLDLSVETVEGCEFAIALIDKATVRDWEDIGRAAGLKSRPRTTIPLLRAGFERRLRAARAVEAIR
jgi:hypothetical protein